MTGTARPDWLAVLQEQALALESAAASTHLSTPVPDCPGWDVADLLGHVGAVHRMVVAWTSSGRRAGGWARPPSGDELAWYGDGWRSLLAHLTATGAGTRVPTWGTADDTAGFWYRRMAHETAVHSLDMHRAAGREQGWSVPDAFATDGVDEALRLFLAGRLGTAAGDGSLVQVRVPGRWWAVALHASVVEVGEPEPGPFADLVPDAVVRGPAPQVYRWVWGRDAQISESGDPAAVRSLRAALTRATQ